MQQKLKKGLEFVSEKILMISGGVTSLTILLIVLFLFKESSGLFQSPIIEDGYVLAVNPNNQIQELQPQQIKEIFDAEIINWKDVGGQDEEIFVFRLSDLQSYFSDEELGENFENIPTCISNLIGNNSGIVAFFPKEYVAKNFQGRLLNNQNISFTDFCTGKEWFPTAQPAPLFGVLPLILGTLWVSLAAILFALPFGLAAAIYLAELASERKRKILKPLFELLAGIPSVVYGFFGLVVLVPFIQNIFNLAVGETALVGSIILAIMALPTIITVAEDAIRNVPRATKEASLALGATHWQTIWRVILPYSISGIIAAVVLGVGRAIGETMAVLMVTGNSAVIPSTLLEPIRTIPATIAAELGEAPNGGVHYQALFLLGCILFLITLTISITVEVIVSKRPKETM